MFLVSYLAHDTENIAKVQERLALAKPPMTLVVARSAPELINQAQTLPIRAVIADVTWPRATWAQLLGALRHLYPDLPVLALADGATDEEWWQIADDLLRIDERLELFLHRLERIGAAEQNAAPSHPGLLATPSAGMSSGVNESTPLLDNPQFRQFAEIFAGLEEPMLIETFVGWVQQACQTPRALLLLRDPESGDFICRAQRGLPSTLVPHYTFAQTSPLCRWLATTGRILLRDGSALQIPREVIADLDLLQSVAAVPVMFDGQLVAILGIGPRLIGQWYSASELEALFAIGGQVAMAMHHCRMNHDLRVQQEMTEHMLNVMPSGSIVLSADNRIAFVNPSAALMLDKSRAALQGMDLRALPSPLGDLAYAVLLAGQDQARRELTLATNGHPIAVTGFALHTTPPSAMLLIEDLSAQKKLEEERERRVNLEVLTNLVHYLAHELRNPLVALSTFSNLMPTRADDPEFQEFCDSVLSGEIGRVNLILEQLLVLTDHVELQFSVVELAPILERVTNTEDMRASVVVSVPVLLPSLKADAPRLETALTCILRTAMRLSTQLTPVTVQVEVEAQSVAIRVEVPTNPHVTPEWLLNPWKQLMEVSEQDVDLGLATAKYILEEHGGTLAVVMIENVLTITSRLPLRVEKNGQEEGWHDAKESARRR